MFKKLLILVAFLAFCTGLAQAEVKTHIYGGGKVIVPSGDTEGWGLGSMVGFGVEASDKVILWGNVNNSKSEEGFTVDEYLVGTTLLTDYLIKNIKTGAYLLFEGGWTKLEDESSKFGTLSSLGFYADVTPTTKLWIGGGYSHTKGVKLYAIQVGLSISP